MTLNSKLTAEGYFPVKRMSWGELEKTARTAAGEQWTYVAGVLTFKNGVVVNIR